MPTSGFHSRNRFLEFEDVGFCPVEGGKLENREKNPRSKAKTNNKLNPRMARGRNRTQATLVGGECSQHCTISALENEHFRYLFMEIVEPSICDDLFVFKNDSRF